MLIAFMLPGGPAFNMYDGPAEMMLCSSPCLDPIRFLRSGEFKKTDAVARFKHLRSFRIPKGDVLAFSLHHFSTIFLSSSPLASRAYIRNSLWRSSPNRSYGKRNAGTWLNNSSSAKLVSSHALHCTEHSLSLVHSVNGGVGYMYVTFI